MVWITSRAGGASTDDQRPNPESEWIILMAAEEPRASDARVITSYVSEGDRFVIVRR